MGALPPHERARCACVCRAWRAAVADVSLWLRLDLTSIDGVQWGLARRTEALLRGAARRARNQLEFLAAPGSQDLWRAVSHVVAANSDSLREVWYGVAPCGNVNVGAPSAAAVEDLLRAAPELPACHVAIAIGGTNDLRFAGPMLCGEPPFAALRVHHLELTTRMSYGQMLRLAADVAACPHGTLSSLRMYYVHLDSAAVTDALVDALVVQRCSSLTLSECYTTPAAASWLAHLLRGGALTELAISHDNNGPLLDAPAATLLAGALRECSTLRSLELRRVPALSDARIAAALLPALTAHPSLRRLILVDDGNGGCDDATAACLGALVAANAPLELLTLDLGPGQPGEEWLRPLLEALPRNTRLRELCCSSQDVSEAFARDALLPAVRANAGLRCLGPSWQFAGLHVAPSLGEALALLDRRARDADATL